MPWYPESVYGLPARGGLVPRLAGLWVGASFSASSATLNCAILSKKGVFLAETGASWALGAKMSVSGCRGVWASRFRVVRGVWPRNLPGVLNISVKFL